MADRRAWILAGYRRSLVPVLLLDAIRARAPRGVRVEAVVVVSELSPRRVLAWRRRFGGAFLGRALGAAGIGRAAREDPERAALLARLGSSSRPPTIRERCREHGLRFHVVSGPNDPGALRLFAAGRPDVVLNAGGGILRRPFLALAGAGVVNMHSGPLPHVRGMSAVEWSLWLGLVPAATLHWIDAGVDTGGILGWTAVAVRRDDRIGDVRGRTLLAGIDLLADRLEAIAAGQGEPSPNPRERGRQYFEMAEPLRSTVASWIAEGVTPLRSHIDVDPDDLRSAVERRAS